MKEQLFSNIIVLGGGSEVKGLKERLMKDLRRETTEGTNLNIKIGKGGVQGAFLGMQNIARHQRSLISKMSYQKDAFL